MDNPESKDLLDIDDFEMDELLTEFAEEENKNSVVEISDSEDEMDKLVEEFATTLSDSEEEEPKTGAKVILSSSDDEIDNLLDGFNDDDSVENEPEQETDSVSVKKEIYDDSYDQNEKSIIIKDSKTQNDIVYDSAIEIAVSDEIIKTTRENLMASNISNSETKGSQPISLSGTVNNIQKQSCDNFGEDVENKMDSANTAQDFFKKIIYSRAGLTENSSKNNELPKRHFLLSNNNYVPIAMKVNENSNNLNTLVKSLIDLNDLKKNPPPLSVTNVTISCDENVLKPKNGTVGDLSMSKIIEHAIDNCLKNKSNIPTVISSKDKIDEKELTNHNVDSDANREELKNLENSSEVMPIMINDVRGSDYSFHETPESNDSDGDSVPPKSFGNIAENETKSVSAEDVIKTENNSFPLTALSIKSEDKIKSKVNDNSDTPNSCPDSELTSQIPSEKKIFHSSQDINYLPLDQNNSNLSKNVMNSIYTEQPTIPKIALEIKIHISSDDISTKICDTLNESGNSVVSHSDKNENSKTAGISINLNGLADKFVVPIANVTDKKETLYLGTNNDFCHKETASNTLEHNELSIIPSSNNCHTLNESENSVVSHSVKNENFNTAGVSINLNGLEDMFVDSIVNVTDKKEALSLSTNNDSNTLELNELKDKDLPNILNSNNCHTLNESENSVLSHSVKNENSNTAGISINLNKLADKFIVPVANVIDKKEALHLNNDFCRKEIASNTLELNELKDKDLSSIPSDNNCQPPPIHELKKRKLETSDCKIGTKKRKQETCSPDILKQIDEDCDIATLVLNEINKVIPLNSNQSIKVNTKGLDHLVYHALKKSLDTNFHEAMNDAEKVIKDLEKKSENLSKANSFLFAALQEFRSTQKAAYISNSYKKVGSRTVGINVKIINVQDIEIIKITDKASSNESKSTKEENEIPVQEKKDAAPLKENVTLKEKEDAPLLIGNVRTVVKEKSVNEQLSSLITSLKKKNDKSIKEKKASVFLETGKPTKEKEVSELPKTVTKITTLNERTPDDQLTSLLTSLLQKNVKKDKEASELSETKVSKNLSINGPKSFSKVEQKLVPAKHRTRAPPRIIKLSNIDPFKKKEEDLSFDPTKIGPPNVVKSGGRLIPYLNPTKRIPAYSTLLKSFLELPQLPHKNSLKSPDTVKKGTCRGNEIFPQHPSLSEHVKVPLDQFLHMYPSAKFNATKSSVTVPFQTVQSSVAPTTTTKSVTYAIPQNSPSYVRSFPSVSHLYRPEMMRPPGVPPGIRASSADNKVFTTSPTGYVPNGDHLSNQFRYSQSYSRQGPMVPTSSYPFPLHHTATTASYPMPQPNIQSPFMHHPTNSAYNPLNTMNYLSSSMGYPPPSQPHSVTSANHPSSVVTSPSFYPRTLANHPLSFQPHPNFSANHFTSSLHDPIQQKAPTNPSCVSAAGSPSPQASKLTAVTTPSPPPSSKSESVNSIQKIPPLPESLTFNSLPKPKLNITKDENDVVLSWNVDLKASDIVLKAYQIYSCHVNSEEIQILPTWKKVGDVAALRLPMACRLRQFEKDNSYHFIVRVVDTYQRLGPFSDPASVSI